MTTTYTFEDLKADVRKEAEALRVHATDGELDKLNFAQLNGQFIGDCIYGQMTGHCYTERASELISLCACRYVREKSLTEIKHEGFERIARNINGTYVSNLHEDRTQAINKSHYSAIEAYILLPEAKNANLIAYLRGETDTLDL